MDADTPGISNAADSDPLLRLRGSGKELWAEEHADEYVRRLRDDWKELDKDNTAK